MINMEAQNPTASFQAIPHGCLMSSMTTLSLRVIGPPKVFLGDQPLEVGLKPTVLLTLLALHPAPNPLSRDQLAAWLWPDKPNPLGNLSSALNKLREPLGVHAFGNDERTRTLWLNTSTPCDLLEAKNALDSDNPNTWKAAWQLGQEPFLAFPDPHWETRCADTFQDWLHEQREQHHTLHRDLAALLAQHHLERHEWQTASKYLATCKPETGDPREQLNFYAILVHTALNQPEQAIRVHVQLCTVLQELGGKPSSDAEIAFELARTWQIAAAKGLLEELFLLNKEATDMPFVGRETELERLSATVPASLEGKAHAIVLTGEPGAGKTELARRLVKRLDPNRRAYLHSEGFCERLTPAWRTFDLVVRQLVRARRHEVEAMGTELRAALARFVPDLLESSTTSANDDERLLFLAIRWLLTHDERPTLLFLDDAQWIDAPSLGLVQELLRKPPPRGLLLLMTQRDTESQHHSLERLMELIHRERLGIEHALKPLDVLAVETLLDERGQVDANPEWLQEQSGGNPLYLLEMLDTAYRTPGSLPPRLEQLVQARIKALPDQAREVLESCAVLGEGSTLGEARTVSGLPFEDTVHALTFLREVRLLKRADAQISFNHDVTIIATQALTSPERKQLLNLRAAQARLDRPELAARHFWAAMADGKDALATEDMQPVVEVFSLAATVSALRGDLPNGNIWFDRTLNLAPDATRRVRTLTQRARVYERLYDFDGAFDDLNQAELLSAGTDALTHAGVLNARGLLLATCLGDAVACQALSSRALDMLKDVHSPAALSERANALSNLGVAAWQSHRLDQGEANHREALAIRRALNEPEQVAGSLQNLGLVLTSRGDPTAREHFEEAKIILEHLGNRAGVANALTNIGWLEWRLGSLTQAEDHFLQAIEAGSLLGSDFNSDLIHNNIGAVRFLQGRYREAHAAYLIALQSSAASRHSVNKATYHSNLAEVELRLLRLDDAAKNLDAGFELLKKTPNPGLETSLVCSQAELYALRCEPAKVRATLQQAIKLAAQNAKTDQHAESLARLARLEQNTERAAQALALRDTPETQVACIAADGDFETAMNLLHQSTIYEQTRLALDAAAVTGDPNWVKRAEGLLNQLATHTT
jgi:tetratricopeptide (TPR) repeat protein/DNA-binding SARP family transcriptional activator